jgi:hypothetical protein
MGVTMIFFLEFCRFFWSVKSAEQSGWTDWATFRPMGDCLLWAVFGKYRTSLHFCITFFYAFFWQKISWATFWVFFFTNSSGHPECDRTLSALISLVSCFLITHIRSVVGIFYVPRLVLSLHSKLLMPWRCGAVVVAIAWGTDDPGSNPARL